MHPIERMNPFENDKDLMFPEHYGRYMFAEQLCKDKTVIDCSCGNGYGSFYLSQNGAKSVTGIDLSEEALTFCRKHYHSDNLDFLQGDATKLDFIESQTIDAFVCFETIEHIQNVDRLLSEIRRVLKKEGILIISCPNDNIFNPDNPFHVDVYTKAKFTDLIGAHFEFTQLWVQNNTTGTSIFEPKHIEHASIEQEPIINQAYPVTPKKDELADTWLIVCSNRPITEHVLPVNCFFTTYSQYVQEMNNTVQALYGENQKLSRAWQEQVDYIKKVEQENSRLSDSWKIHTDLIKQQEATIREFQTANKNSVEENERLATAWMEHTEYIKRLEENNKKLADAWDTHTVYIKNLEQQLKQNQT